MLPLRITASLLNFIRLGAVDATEVGEEQQPSMGGRHKEVLDHIVSAELRTPDTFTTAVLAPVVVAPSSLDIATAGDRDDHLFLGNQVFIGHSTFEALEDLSPTVITKTVHYLLELLGHDRALSLVTGEDGLVFGDHLFKLCCLVHDLLTLERCQATKLEVQDGESLILIDTQEFLEALFGLFDSGGLSNEGDDLIQSVQGLEITAEDVSIGFCFIQAELCPANNHLNLVANPEGNETIQRQGSGNPVHNGQHVGAKVLLQGRVLVQVVEDYLRDRVTFENNDQSLSGPTRCFVPNVSNSAEFSFFDEVSDLDGQVVWVHLIRKLGDHKTCSPLNLLYRDDCAHRDRPTTRAIGVLDSFGPKDLSAGGEIWTLNLAHGGLEKLFPGSRGIREVPQRCGCDLAQVVGWDVGGHTHGNTH